MARPIRMVQSGVTKFQRLAGAARQKAAFRKLVMLKGKPK